MRYFFIVILPIFLCSCTKQFEYISVEEFNNFYDNEFELIDVRTVEEFQSGHILGAINIDFLSLDLLDEINEIDTNSNLIIYCRTDNRSRKSAKILADNKYKNVYVIKGGIDEWTSQGNPLSF
jgi:rhodanese-related sulfurtransferase